MYVKHRSAQNMSQRKSKDARMLSAVPHSPALYATSKMLFGILFACLYRRQPKSLYGGGRGRTFAGLPTFAPITFHLFVSYSLMALRRA